MTVTAHWFTSYERVFGFPVEKAALGGCNLSVAYIGGEWQWLVNCRGREVAEGAARGYPAARSDAENAVRRFLQVVARAAQPGRADFPEHPFRDSRACRRNIETTPLCKVEVTLPRVLGSREVRRGGGVDERLGNPCPRAISVQSRSTRSTSRCLNTTFTVSEIMFEISSVSGNINASTKDV
jgi:hypothetical protein